jgi:hypothetical protein
VRQDLDLQLRQEAERYYALSYPRQEEEREAEPTTPERETLREFLQVETPPPSQPERVAAPSSGKRKVAYTDGLTPKKVKSHRANAGGRVGKVIDCDCRVPLDWKKLVVRELFPDLEFEKRLEILFHMMRALDISNPVPCDEHIKLVCKLFDIRYISDHIQLFRRYDSIYNLVKH